jgi:hypothetical protein
VSDMQVFVLMQFGRKKDWPHGKIVKNYILLIKIDHCISCKVFPDIFDFSSSGKEIPIYKDEL